MRALTITAAAVSGGAVGLVVGVLLGTAVPNQVIPAGVIPLLLALTGGIGASVAVARSWPQRQDGKARRVRRPG